MRTMPRTRRAAASAVVLLAATLVGSVAAPAHAGDTKAPKVELDAKTKKQLAKILDEQFEQLGMPGIAARVIIGDDQWQATRGVRDLETKQPYKIGDNVRIASITKSFTATAILQLVDEGKLSLDQTVEEFVPGIPNGDQITVRDVLAMQSGIYDFTTNQPAVDAFTANPAFEWTPDDAVALMQQNPSQFEPGSQTVYADSNYVLLGIILEQVTGKDAADVVNDQVVSKVGLRHTTFPKTPTLRTPHPTGYVPDPDDPSVPLTPVGDINPEFAWTAGAMTSTVDDLEKWAEVLADGSLLKRSTQRERLKEHRFANVSINAGYGLGVERINDIVGHNGAVLGFSTAMYRYPQADATFVVTGNASTNSTTPTSEIALLMMKALYPDQVK